MSKNRATSPTAPLLVRFQDNGSVQSYSRSDLKALSEALDLTETGTVREALIRLHDQVLGERNKRTRNGATPSGLQIKQEPQ